MILRQSPPFGWQAQDLRPYGLRQEAALPLSYRGKLFNVHEDFSIKKGVYPPHDLPLYFGMTKTNCKYSMLMNILTNFTGIYFILSNVGFIKLSFYIPFELIHYEEHQGGKPEVSTYATSKVVN